MKNNCIFALLLLFAAIGGGCSNDTPYFQEPGGGTEPGTEETVGHLDLTSFVLTMTDDVEQLPSSGGVSRAAEASTRAAATSEVPGDYNITITNNKTLEVAFSGTYAELKAQATQPLPLTPSSYTIHAESPNYTAIPNVDWDVAAFAGTKIFTIVKNSTTDLSGKNALVCTLANIKTTVSLTADLDRLFEPDSESQKLTTTLTMGSNPIVFQRTEKRAAYFKAVENLNTISVRLRGRYNKAAEGENPSYVPVDWKQEIPFCKAGQWRNITITVLNADKGNVQFQLTVETWAYDESIDVDVAHYYTAMEETIPDEEVSDEGAPTIKLEGKDIAQIFNLNSSMFDFDINYCSNMITAVASPTAGSTVEKLSVVFESDNDAFLAALTAAGFAENRIELWPVAEGENPLKSHVVMKQSANDLIAKVTFAGMKGLYDFTGTHTLKFAAKDSQNRTSYTKLSIKVTHSSSSEQGPSVVWRDHDFESTYNNVGLDVKIDVTSKTGITGFLVDIDSPNVLPSDELEGMGLATHMDLINPATDKMAQTLTELNFPIRDQIKDKTALLFDISTFMPMLSALGRNGYCNFTLTVTDASGTNTKTIKLTVKVN